MKYKCKLCGYEISEEEYKDITIRCPKCGSDRYSFEVYQEAKEIDKKVFISDDNPSINRVLETCINCGMCKKTCNALVGLNKEGEKSFCINCGNCILTCPTASLTVKYDFKKVEELIKSDKIVIAFTAPGVRVTLGECFNLESGTNVEGKMVSALRLIGFDYVLDTTFGADMTVMEEAKELIERKKNNGALPMFTSCCPSWVKYVHNIHPEFKDNLSTVKSPNAMMGSLIKSYFAKEKKLDPQNIITVGIVPCVSKKNETKREDLINNGLHNLDYMLTTTELGLMIKENNIDFNNLEEGKFDELMGTGSSAGLIFGTSGGVMEAILRTASYLLMGKEDIIEISEIRGDDFFRSANIKLGNISLKVAVIYGIENANNLLKKIRNKEETFDFIEVMTCENGCIGGGGTPLQNLNKIKEIRKKRLETLYDVDELSKVKASYQNEQIKKVYNDFLNEENIEELLHIKEVTRV